MTKSLTVSLQSPLLLAATSSGSHLIIATCLKMSSEDKSVQESTIRIEILIIELTLDAQNNRSIPFFLSMLDFWMALQTSSIKVSQLKSLKKLGYFHQIHSALRRTVLHTYVCNILREDITW